MQSQIIMLCILAAGEVMCIICHLLAQRELIRLLAAGGNKEEIETARNVANEASVCGFGIAAFMLLIMFVIDGR